MKNYGIKLTLPEGDPMRNAHLLGEDWERTHQICQMHEGTPIFDWLHALIHRIEGDDANAGYWYRRAGKIPQSCDEQRLALHPG